MEEGGGRAESFGDEPKSLFVLKNKNILPECQQFYNKGGFDLKL